MLEWSCVPREEEKGKSMDAFTVAFLVCVAGFVGFGLGYNHALSCVKLGKLEQDGLSYSYFRNSRKRSKLGRG